MLVFGAKTTLNIRHLLLVLLTGTFLTIILTWPFLLNLTTFFTDNGDYPFNVSQLWYNQDSFATGRIFHQKEYIRGYQFYPQPYSYAFANNALIPSLIFSSIYWVTGNIIFSGNFYSLLAFILSFLSAFYLVYYFLDSPDKKKSDRLVFLASLIGAFVFTFNANTMVRFPQHVDVLGKYFLPLVFLFSFKFFQKPRFKTGVLFALFFTLNALTNNYYEIITIILLPLFALTFFIKHIWNKDWSYFIDLFKTGIVFAIFLPVLVYFNLPYLQFSQKEGVSRTLGDTIFFSARINDWFGSSTDNLLYGNWMKSLDHLRTPKDDRGILNYEEHTLFLGLLPLILFIIGLKNFNRQKINKAYFYLALIVSAVLMLGPFFDGQESFFKLPFYFLYEWIPIIRGIRSPTRFEFLLFIPFAVIVSSGAKEFLEKFTKNKKNLWIPVFAVMTILLILENLTLKDFSVRSSVFSIMDKIGIQNLGFLKDKVTIHLPIYDTSDADNFGNNATYTNWITKTREKLINGDTSYLPPDQLMFLSEVKQKMLDSDVISMLKALKTDYVIIHKDLLSPQEKVLFAKQQSFFQNAFDLDTGDIAIINLGRINLNPKLCTFEKDFDIQLGKAKTDIETLNEKQTYAMVIKNTGDCYMPSIYEDRYRQIDVTIDGIKKKANVRMPIIIRPGEDVTFSEIYSNLRIE